MEVGAMGRGPCLDLGEAVATGGLVHVNGPGCGIGRRRPRPRRRARVPAAAAPDASSVCRRTVASASRASTAASRSSSAFTASSAGAAGHPPRARPARPCAAPRRAPIGARGAPPGASARPPRRKRPWPLKVIQARRPRRGLARPRSGVAAVKRGACGALLDRQALRLGGGPRGLPQQRLVAPLGRPFLFDGRAGAAHGVFDRHLDADRVRRRTRPGRPRPPHGPCGPGAP